MQAEVTLLPKFANRQAFLAQAKADNKAFFEAYKGRVLVEYVRYTPEEALLASIINPDRPKRHGAPNAVFVAYRNDDGIIGVGWAASHPWSPDAFNKTIGLWKAIRRATGEGRPAPNLPGRLSDFKDFGIQAEEWLGGKFLD